MSEMTDQEQTLTEVATEGSERRVRGTGWIASKVPLLFVVAVALVFHVKGGDMAVGTLSQPGPGFWPRVLVISLIVSSVVGLCVDLTDGIEAFELSNSVRVLAGFVALCLFVVVFQNTGMILAGMILLMLWLKGLNGESWRLSAIIAVVAPILTYLLFAQALGVRFPDDIVASLWGGR
ncbi:tripartite tricarboxylate transporter TctB family protein [Janibacter alittae]|uniref:Tripartite tricarboxylate transporter TctB family protein n=1 Tax=Janibacter alittae TaxID=3115209 RepID=A0ABZ2MG73_9MICO